MKQIHIPKPETKVKRLFVPVTPSYHKKIKEYCRERNVKLTELVRFALKQTCDL